MCNLIRSFHILEVGMYDTFWMLFEGTAVHKHIVFFVVSAAREGRSIHQ
jgi:hypothetical protein